MADETVRLCKAFAAIAKVLGPLKPAERWRVFAALLCLFDEDEARVALEYKKMRTGPDA